MLRHAWCYKTKYAIDSKLLRTYMLALLIMKLCSVWFVVGRMSTREEYTVYNASGEISPSVLASAALYALNTEGVSPPYSD